VFVIYKYFLYTVCSGSNSIYAYEVLPNGTLSTLGGFSSAGSAPWGATSHPSGDYMYAANFGSGSVTSFFVAPNGALTQVGSAGMGQHIEIKMNPAGTFIYAGVNNGNALVRYAINGGGGAVNDTGISLGSLAQPWGLAIHPSGSTFTSNARVTPQSPNARPGWPLSTIYPIV
jgi:6-phosphogluconolactonase (cycloisomerase 2 family)